MVCSHSLAQLISHEKTNVIKLFVAAKRSNEFLNRINPYFLQNKLQFNFFNLDFDDLLINRKINNCIVKTAQL